MSEQLEYQRCKRCGIGIDDDQDGNCAMCANWPDSAAHVVLVQRSELNAATLAAAQRTKPVYCLGWETVHKVAENGSIETEHVNFVAADDLLHKPPKAVEAANWALGQMEMDEKAQRKYAELEQQIAAAALAAREQAAQRVAEFRRSTSPLIPQLVHMYTEVEEYVRQMPLPTNYQQALEQHDAELAAHEFTAGIECATSELTPSAIRNVHPAILAFNEQLQRHDTELLAKSRDKEWFTGWLAARLQEQDEMWIDAMGWTDLVHAGVYTQEDRKRYVKLLVESVTYNMIEKEALDRLLAGARAEEAAKWQTVVDSLSHVATDAINAAVADALKERDEKTV